MKKHLLLLLLFQAITFAQIKRDTSVKIKINDLRKLTAIVQELQQTTVTDALRLRIKLDLQSLYGKFEMVIDSVKVDKGKGGNVK